MFLWHNVVEPAFAGIRFAITSHGRSSRYFRGDRLYVVTVLAPLLRGCCINSSNPYSGACAYISAV